MFIWTLMHQGYVMIATLAYTFGGLPLLVTVLLPQHFVLTKPFLLDLALLINM